MNDPILQFFTYAHLSSHLQFISKPFCDLAHAIVRGDNVPEAGTVTIGGPFPQNQECTIALRKLLEAKDAAVRAVLFDRAWMVRGHSGQEVFPGRLPEHDAAMVEAVDVRTLGFTVPTTVLRGDPPRRMPAFKCPECSNMEYQQHKAGCSRASVYNVDNRTIRAFTEREMEAAFRAGVCSAVSTDGVDTAVAFRKFIEGAAKGNQMRGKVMTEWCYWCPTCGWQPATCWTCPSCGVGLPHNGDTMGQTDDRDALAMALELAKLCEWVDTPIRAFKIQSKASRWLRAQVIHALREGQ